MLNKYGKYNHTDNTKEVLLCLAFVILFFALAFFIFFIVKYEKHVEGFDQTELQDVNMQRFEEPYQGLIGNNVKDIIIKDNNADVQLKPQATYRMYGRLYTKHRVPKYEELGTIMPYDMVIGWGKMADPDVFKYVTMSYEGSDRYVFVNVSKKASFDITNIEDCFGNNHMIPANANIRKGLDVLKIKDIVYVEGYLVNLQVTQPNAPDRFYDTSLWRDDAGEGACEIVYVTRVVSRHGDYQ